MVNIDQIWKFLIILFFVALMYVGAGITFLMSISDGRILTFCRKMERRDAGRRKWTDEKLFPAKVGFFIL